MCLQIKQNSTPKIAKKDIRVYKAVVKSGEMLWTVYRYFHVKLGETYYSELEKKDEFIFKGLHSYVKKKDAIQESIITEDCIVIECVIPKGSVYYTGKFYNMCTNTKCSIASDTLTYTTNIIK